MANSTKLYTVDKFLGINEAGDGDTELNMGEASRMVNFQITDAYNLKLRPGIVRMHFSDNRTPAHILAAWAGHIGDTELLVVCDFYDGQDRIFLYGIDGSGQTLKYSQSGALGLTSADGAVVNVFTFNGELYVMSTRNTVAYQGGTFVKQEPYIPLVIAGAAPAGGGTTLENINLLSALRRIDYSADGEATAYVLPDEAIGVTAIAIDNEEKTVSEVGTFDLASHTFTFTTAPVKGVGNVEITYTTDSVQAEASRMQILACRLHEEYNGSTDTRLFVAGNGTNMCYYTGVPEDGKATAMYFPAMNEVAVDMSGSAVTGLRRHYSKLLVFKEDGTHTISYEPVTLTDGTTVAGFYLRPMHREYGNAVMGQIQTVNNYPRSITNDGIYEWRVTTSYYKDERYAVRVSDVVQQSLRSADVSKIVTCEDGFTKTYYAFLNDSDGTVLVNRYGLGKNGVWCIYQSSLLKDVRWAVMFNGYPVIFSDTEAFRFDDSVTMDDSEVSGGDTQQVKAVWESGFMSFGADFRRKYSSYIYLSILPEANSTVTVTAETDKRGDYMEKTVENNVFDWKNANFVDWTFNINDRPGINRVRLKVKKFVYYKLIFRIDVPGAAGTILGFDQQIRFSSMAK